jgi:superfamily II DNA or RNA helicase
MVATEVQQKKYNRQLLGFDRWKRAADLGKSYKNCWGTWNWFTGVGKTYGACIVINSMLTKNNAATAIVMVPGPDLKKQWTEEIRANIVEEYWINITIYTVGEIQEKLSQGLMFVCTLFIADELHEYYTDERLKIFDGISIQCKGMLGLTATYHDIHGRHKAMEKILPIVDVIDEEEARREGYISHYIEYNVAVELTSKEREKYDVLSNIIKKNLSFFAHRGLKLAALVLQGDKDDTGMNYAIRYASEHGWRAGMNIMNPEHRGILEIWSPQKVMGYAKLVMDNIRERNKLLYSCYNKLEMAAQVVDKSSDLKTICFSQSTEFADRLGETINSHYQLKNLPEPCVVYHSQLKTIIVKDESTGKESKRGLTRLKKDAIAAFISGEKRIMSTGSALDKGLNVKDIRLALTTSGTQNPTQYRQRKGRAVRVESYVEDIMVLIVNLYARATQDEGWLRKRQSTSNNIVYWVDNIHDINYTPSNSDSTNLNLEM